MSYNMIQIYFLYSLSTPDRHWTLLKLDIATWEWTFFNSLKSENQSCEKLYMEDALKMVRKSLIFQIFHLLLY